MFEMKVLHGKKLPSEQNKVLMEVLFDGIDVDECGETMTVKQLKERLSEFNDDSPVYFVDSLGCRYGAVVEDYIY